MDSMLQNVVVFSSQSNVSWAWMLSFILQSWHNSSHIGAELQTFGVTSLQAYQKGQRVKTGGGGEELKHHS